MASAQPLEVVQKTYEAFGKGDVPGILSLVADKVDWKFCGTRGLPYTGAFRDKNAVAKFFAGVGEVDDVQAFEPREFLVAGDKVTVIGWEKTKAKPSGKTFESDWVHVFTIRDGRITRFWGMYDTEASAGAR